MAIAKQEILDAIGSMSVLELSQLIKDMEEKFGVSAAAAVAAAAPAAAAAGAATETAAAAETPNFSSMSLMSCESSRTVSFDTASRICARSMMVSFE